MKAEQLLFAESIERRYPGGRQIGPLDLQLVRGEVVGLLGPNGAGKSTTMAMLCGALAPTSGKITLAGHNLAESPIAAKKSVGYLPEEPPLYPDMTVDQYLLYCARLRGQSRHAAHQRLAQVKRECNLEEVGPRLIAHLSKGFRQRTGIAQAIIHDPQIVILDEPANGLDPFQIQQLHELIKRLSGSRAVLLSTHILSEAAALCHRILIMHQGQLHPEQPPDSGDQPGHAELLLALFQHPPTVETLSRLPSLEQVEGTTAGALLIHTDSPAQAIAEISAAALTNGWGLREIGPSRPTLEQRFLGITQQLAVDGAKPL